MIVRELADSFTGSMRGRCMYVMPCSIGRLGDPRSLLAVQVTDSPLTVRILHESEPYGLVFPASLILS